MSKPTFVFVPGGSHTPQVFDGVRSRLTAHGFDSVAVPLPSVGGKPPSHDLSDDVKAISNAVNGVMDQGKDVVVVLHSYASIPGSEALVGAGKTERQKMGLDGGVVRLVFIAAFMATEGWQAASTGDTSRFPPFWEMDLDAGIAVTPPEYARSIFYNDLPDDIAAQWVSKVQPQSLGPFWSKTTYAAWRYIPSTYVDCERDQTFPPGFLLGQLEVAKASGQCAIDVEEKCDSGHFPFLSQEDWTVKMLRRAAGEVVVG